MNRHLYQWFLTLGLFCAFAGTPSAQGASDGLNLVGLAMHRETGRDIYLAALRADRPMVSPAAIVTTPGAREMEFRIVARRTSIRSILGGILLQAEVASGSPPPAAVVSFANDIMGSVSGSLYADDHFALLDTGDGATVASVNGVEMARSGEAGVFDYFLSGWVGEHGPTTAFRSSLVAEDLDVDLRASYKALEPEAARVTEVAAWVAPEPEPEPEPAPKAEPPAAEPEQQVASAEPAPEPEPAAASEPATARPVPEPAPMPKPEPAVAASAAAQSVDRTAPSPDSTPRIAMAKTEPAVEEAPEPAAALAEETEPEEPSGAAALSVIEYSQRLAAFNSMVFRMVNTKIRYPRAAIRRSVEGQLELDVTVNPDGSLVDVSMGRSSGHDMLDDAALRAARSAFEDDFAEPLDEVAIAEYSIAGGQLVIPVPVNFVLTD